MINVGLLGGGGLVGETYRRLLKNHPHFKLIYTPSRDELGDFDKAKGCALLFSALPSKGAAIYEPLYAKRGFPVFSSASCHRMEKDIPLIIPEINPEHFDWIEKQQKNRNWKGFIVSKPNCTLQSILLPLFPLHQRYGLKGVVVTYLQARSGAGKGFHLEENIIPYIAGEEEKSEREVHKILDDPSIKISCHSLRVPVQEGHLATVSATFLEKPPLDEVKKIWKGYDPVNYLEEEDRPQPALDLGDGMKVQIGRLRSCPLMDLRFVALSHNLIRGAAGGGLLTALTWYQNAQASLFIS